MNRTSTAVMLFASLGALSVATPPVYGALPPMYGGNLELPAPAPLRAPDPTAIREPFDATLAAAVFDGLYELSEDGRVRPALASGLPEREGTTVRIPLRRGLQRHDGRQLDADAVVASLERVARADRSRWLLAALAEKNGRPAVHAVDAHTIELVTRDEGIDMARLLTATPLRVVAAGHARRPIGTGPFRASLGAAGVTLRTFDAAAQGAPYLRQVRIHPPRERERALRAFELGHIDASWHGRSLYGGEPVRPVAATPRTGAFPVLLVRNRERGPLRKDATWHALAHAIDRRRLARVGLSPSRSLADGVRAKPMPGGRKPDDRVVLRMPVAKGSVFEERLAEALAGILDETGFSLVVERGSPARRRARIRSGAWELRAETVVAPLPGATPMVGAALAASGQQARARRLARDNGLFDPKHAPAAARELDALVLGQRRDVLYHRADLQRMRFDPLGQLRLAGVHMPRNSDGGTR